MKYKNGEEFLNKLYKRMHLEKEVMHTATKNDTKEEKITKYLERLEKTHTIASSSEHKMDILKKFYYDKYIIKELPESYIDLQKKIAKERGYGEIKVTDEMKKEMLLYVQKEQQKSLDMWIDYLTSDDAIYPIWFKHYVFKGMIKLSKFSKEEEKFSKRSKTTTDPYIELNREVLAKIYDTLIKEIGSDKELTEEEIKALENGESFKKLYEYYLTKKTSKEISGETEGIWVKYDQGSDYRPLWESLQGKNTGWCTAGEITAKTQLENGDFYVYYTKDKNNKYKDPRIAIRMDGTKRIGEIRGIEEHQNLEGNMSEILKEKLTEFQDKDNYLKKVNDMKTLTEIENKVNNNLELTKEELRFLYEIDSKIKGFGYNDDPRIEEIRKSRNNKKDLAFIFNCKEENIGTKLSDFDNNEIIVFYGNLTYDNEKLPKTFKKLKYIYGSATFSNLTRTKDLENLQNIGGDALFPKLTRTKDLENLQNIGGDASFFSLTSAEGLESLQNIGGSARFDELTNAKGLESLQNIGVSATFPKLTSAEGLENLQTIGGNAWFDGLTNAEGLENLQSIGGHAWFPSLTNAEGLVNLQSIGGHASFDSLTSAKGLESLQNIGVSATFDSLTSAKGLENLQSIGGSARFDELTNAKGLESLQNIGGSATFPKLTNAKGLESLQTIGGDAWFDGLTNAEGLVNLQTIGEYASFDSLTSAKGLENLQTIGEYASFDSLTNAEGLESLQTVFGEDATILKEEINSRSHKKI